MRTDVSLKVTDAHELNRFDDLFMQTDVFLKVIDTV